MADKRAQGSPAGVTNYWEYERAVQSVAFRPVVPPSQVGDPDRDNVFVVCIILPGGVARIHATSNLADAIRQWRRRYGSFLLVSVYRVPGDVFCRAVGLPRLPAVVSIGRAAQLFRRLPYSAGSTRVALRQIDSLGESAVSLFQDWQRAVTSAEGESEGDIGGLGSSRRPVGDVRRLRSADDLTVCVAA